MREGKRCMDARPSSACGPCLAGAVRERVRVAGVARRRARSAAARQPCGTRRLPAGRRALAAPGPGSIVQLARNARAAGAPACAMARRRLWLGSAVRISAHVSAGVAVHVHVRRMSP